MILEVNILVDQNVSLQNIMARVLGLTGWFGDITSIASSGYVGEVN